MKKRIIMLSAVLAVIICIFSVSTVATNAGTTHDISIDYCNLSFRDTVCIKYAVKSDISNVKLLIWTSSENEYTYGSHDDEITEYYTEEIEGSECMIFDYTKLAAKQMTDVVYACAYAKVDGEEAYSEVNKYSILKYAYNKLGKTSTASNDENLKEMLMHMLEYGAAAQKYLGNYKLDRLATADWYQISVTDGTLDDGSNYGLYIPGEKVTLTAKESNNDGLPFSYWKDSKGNNVGTTTTIEITVGNSNEAYTPVYQTASERYTVTFKDCDGTVLKTETVEKGSSASAPAEPSRDGYIFIGWDKAFDNVTGELTVTARYEKKITAPTISVSSATASAGDSVEIAVKIQNNPGIAGAKIFISYSSKLTLSSAEPGEAFAVLDYTKPASLKSPCPFNWDSLDAESNIDGDILILNFTVSDNVVTGENLEIKASYSSGDIYDVDLSDVTLDLVSGRIIIE